MHDISKENLLRIPSTNTQNIQGKEYLCVCTIMI